MDQQQQFRSLFCERFNCPLSEYQERAFWKCLYWHARFLASVIRAVRPGFFTEDFKFIRYLGDSASFHEVMDDRRNFHDANRGNPSFLRMTFRIRVSGRKASGLAGRLFSEARVRAPSSR